MSNENKKYFVFRFLALMEKKNEKQILH